MYFGKIETVKVLLTLINEQLKERCRTHFSAHVKIKAEHKTDVFDVFSGALLPGACYLFTAWKMEVKIQFLGIRAPCGELVSPHAIPSLLAHLPASFLINKTNSCWVQLMF